MVIDPGRRSNLFAVKLRALARDGLCINLDDATGSPDGATGYLLVDSGSVDSGSVDSGSVDSGCAVVVVLVEDRPEHAVGHALALLKRHGATSGHLLCAVGADLVAARAAMFSTDLTVHEVVGTNLQPVASREPQPMAVPSPEALQWVDTIVSAGADVVVEHGVVTGEVAGLEVARVVLDEFGARLDVGVSTDDRAMFSLLHGHLEPHDALAKVIGIVGEHRRPGAEPHPLNRLSRSRWLRSWLIVNPDVIGMSSLAAAASPVPRSNLKDPVPAAGIGLDANGVEHVVVCSTGVDLELVPFAAQARAMLAPRAPLLIVVPVRDAVPFASWCIDRLIQPAELMTVTNDWAGGDR